MFDDPKRVTTGSRRAKNTCLSIPNGPGSLLEDPVFDPFQHLSFSTRGSYGATTRAASAPVHKAVSEVEEM